MSYSLHWSPKAEKKFLLIVQYIQQNFGNVIAEKFIERVDQSVSALKEMRKAFPEFNKRKNIRRCVITKQTTVYYRIKNDSIELIALFSNHQNPKRLKKLLK